MNTLVNKFNNASRLAVMLGTLGTTAFVYLLLQVLKHRRSIVGATIRKVRALPGAQGLVDKELEKTFLEMEKSLRIEGDTPITRLPEEGWSEQQLLDTMTKLQQAEYGGWKDGKVSGVIYHGGERHVELMNQVYALFTLSNPLHPDVFPSIRKFEAEIVAMTVAMLGNVPGVCGAVTSGGTESILMACKAHRDYYAKLGITQPEMIAPESAHAAFNKAAHYFGIKLVAAPLKEDFSVDVAAVARLINSNTILLVASAPGYAHGVVDDVRALGELALKNNVGLHVDGCLGGFILPWLKRVGCNIPDFDFTVPGVTSMSADTHKYGYAPKGTSVVLFRNKELRRAMYFSIVEWNGGIYASPTIAGSRPGALIATTWASLMSFGEEGYIESARGIAQMAYVIRQAILANKDLYLIGNTETMVVAFSSYRFNIFAIKGLLHKKGWNLNALQKPDALHICITHAQVAHGGGERFAKDLNDVMEIIQADPKKFEGESSDAHLYGIAHGFPDRSLITEITMGYLDLCLTP